MTAAASPRSIRAPTIDDPSTAWHWRAPRVRLAALGLVVAGVAIRLALLPTAGLVGDMEEFAGWIAGIERDGLLRAYDRDLTFPPVMAVVWWLMGLVHPAAGGVADAADPLLRVVMKTPASLADLGLAAALAWWHRASPRRALAIAGAVLLVPAFWYVSAWWGQYEPIFVLWAVLAVVAAGADRPRTAAALLALAVLTKPQAVPFLVPFAAWCWATGGPGRVAWAVATGAVVGIVAWLPFVPANGPLHYLESLRAHQDDVFNVLSLRAWNPWWLIQERLAGGDFVADGNSLVGPVTFRHVGLALFALGEALVFRAVLRRATTERLVLGMAAASLVAYLLLTTMHERYAYPALILLLLLLPDRRLLVAWILLAVGHTANLVAAAPATPEIATLLPISGPVATLMTALLVAAGVLVVGRLLATGRPPADEGGPEGQERSPVTAAPGAAPAAPGAAPAAPGATPGAPGG